MHVIRHSEITKLKFKKNYKNQKQNYKIEMQLQNRSEYHEVATQWKITRYSFEESYNV